MFGWHAMLIHIEQSGLTGRRGTGHWRKFDMMGFKGEFCKHCCQIPCDDSDHLWIKVQQAHQWKIIPRSRFWNYYLHKDKIWSTQTSQTSKYVVLKVACWFRYIRHQLTLKNHLNSWQPTTMPQAVSPSFQHVSICHGWYHYSLPPPPVDLGPSWPWTCGWLAKMQQCELVLNEIGQLIKTRLTVQAPTPTYPVLLRMIGHMLSEDKAQVELWITKKFVSWHNTNLLVAETFSRPMENTPDMNSTGTHCISTFTSIPQVAFSFTTGAAPSMWFWQNGVVKHWQMICLTG